MENDFLCSVCPTDFSWFILLVTLPLYCGISNTQAFTDTTVKEAASKIKMQERKRGFIYLLHFYYLLFLREREGKKKSLNKALLNFLQ